MVLIPNDWKHLLRTENSQKSLLNIFYYKNKVTRKVKDFQKLIVLHTTNLSNSFHDQTSLRDTILSVLISGVKLLLIGLRNALMDNYIFSILYKLIHFSHTLNPAIHRMGNVPNILCPRCKKQKDS